MRAFRFAPVLLLALLLPVWSQQEKDPLPSWNDGPTKQAILAFVRAVTDVGGPYYLPPAERIAVFDNDGTLWCEQPVYSEVIFAMDRARQLLPQHPEWKTQQPFLGLLERDMERMRNLTQAVVTLGHALGMAVVAEGVESEPILALLRQQGCDEAQGYLFTRPLAPAELETWLRAQPG